MRTRNLWMGILLIAMGCVLLANRVFNIELFSMSNFWPIFVLIPGLVFEFSYFASKRNPGLLVPGGILTTYGILFFFETFTNWSFSEYTWPIYPMGVGIGLFQLYLHERHWGLLIPVFILFAVSITAFVCMLLGNILSWVNYSLVVPIVLIIGGIFILFRSYFIKPKI